MAIICFVVMDRNVFVLIYMTSVTWKLWSTTSVPYNISHAKALLSVVFPGKFFFSRKQDDVTYFFEQFNAVV